MTDSLENPKVAGEAKNTAHKQALGGVARKGKSKITLGGMAHTPHIGSAKTQSHKCKNI